MAIHHTQVCADNFGHVTVAVRYIGCLTLTRCSFSQDWDEKPWWGQDSSLWYEVSRSQKAPRCCKHQGASSIIIIRSKYQQRHWSLFWEAWTTKSPIDEPSPHEDSSTKQPNIWNRRSHVQIITETPFASIAVSKQYTSHVSNAPRRRLGSPREKTYREKCTISSNVQCTGRLSVCGTKDKSLFLVLPHYLHGCIWCKRPSVCL